MPFLMRIFPMKIYNILDKHYNELLSTCTSDKVISQSLTEFDILQDICIRALKKFKETEIDEEEGLLYLKKSLNALKFFQRKRIGSEIITFVDDVSNLGV